MKPTINKPPAIPRRYIGSPDGPSITQSILNEIADARDRVITYARSDLEKIGRLNFPN